jgi:hypothetical protein
MVDLLAGLERNPSFRIDPGRRGSKENPGALSSPILDRSDPFSQRISA